MEQDEKYTISIPLLLAIIFQGISAIERIDLPVHHREVHGASDVRTGTQTAKIPYQPETNIKFLPQTKKLMHARENAANRNVNQFLKKPTAGSKEFLWLINYFPLNEQFVNYPHADFPNRDNEYEYFYNTIQNRGFEDGYSYYNGDEPYGDANYPDDEQHQYSDLDMQDDKKVLENIHHFVMEIPQDVFNENYKETQTGKPTACMGNILYPLYADTHNKNLLLGYMHHRIITDPRIFNRQSAVSRQGLSLFNRNYTQIYKDIKDGMVVNHKEYPIYIETGNKKIFIGYLHHIILNATIGSLLKFNQNQQDNIHSMYTNYEKMFADNNINRPVHSNGNSPYVATMSHVIIPFYGIKNQNRLHSSQGQVIQDSRFGVTYFPFREMSAHHGMYYGHSKIGYEKPFSRWPLYNTRVIVYTQRPIMDGNWIERSLGNVREWITPKMLNYIKEMGINMYRQKSGNIFNMYPNYHPQKYWYQESKFSKGYPHYKAVIMHFYIPLEYMPMGNEKSIAKYRNLWQKLMYLNKQYKDNGENGLEKENPNKNSNKPGEATTAESTTLEAIQTDLNKKPTNNYYERIVEMTTKETPEIKEETWITAKPNGFSERAETLINTERETQTPAEEQKTVIFRTEEPEWKTVIFRTKKPEWKIFRTEEPERFSKETSWEHDEREKGKKEPSELTNEPTSGTIETATEETQKTDVWSTDKEIQWGFREREEKDKTKQFPKVTSQPPSEKSEIPSDERWGIEEWGTEAWDHGERYDEKEKTTKNFPGVTNEPTSERTETTVGNEWRTNVWNREETGMSNEETWYKEREKEITKVTELLKLTNQPTSEKTELAADERWGIEEWDKGAWDHGERYDEKEKTTKNFPGVTNEPTSEKTETTVENEWRTNVWNREETEMSNEETWYKEREKEKSEVTEELSKLINQPTSEKTESAAGERWGIEEWDKEAWNHGERYDEKEKTTKNVPGVTNEPTSERTETTVENEWRTNVWNREETEMSSEETWYKEREKEKTKVTELPKLINQPTSEKTESAAGERWGIEEWDKEAWDHGKRYDEKEKTTKNVPGVTNEPTSERTETTVKNEWRTNVWNREETEMSNEETWYKEREKEKTKVTELPKLINQPTSEKTESAAGERWGIEEWDKEAWDHGERYDEKEKTTKNVPGVTNEPTSERTETTVENEWRTNVWNREETEMSNEETWYKEREKEKTKVTELPKLINQPTSEKTESAAGERWGIEEWDKEAWDHGERYDEKEKTTKNVPGVTNEPTSERTETTVENEWRTNVWNREETEMSNEETWYKEREKEKTKVTELPKLINQPTSEKTESAAGERWGIEEWDKEAWDHGERYDEKEKTTKNFPGVTNEPTSERTETTVENEWRTNVWNREETEMSSEETWYKEREKEKSEVTELPKLANQPTSEKTELAAGERWGIEEWDKEAWDHGERYNEKEKTTKNVPGVTNKPTSETTEKTTEEKWGTEIWNTEKPLIVSKETSWNFEEREDNQKSTKTVPEIINKITSLTSEQTAEEWRSKSWKTEVPEKFNTETLPGLEEREKETDKTTQLNRVTNQPTSEKSNVHEDDRGKTGYWNTEEPKMFSKEISLGFGERENEKTTEKYPDVTEESTLGRTETTAEERYKYNVWNTDTEKPGIFSKDMWNHGEGKEETDKTIQKFSEATNLPTSQKSGISEYEIGRTGAWSREEPKIFSETPWSFGKEGKDSEQSEEEWRTRKWSTKEPEIFSENPLWDQGERVEGKDETTKRYNEMPNKPSSELPAEQRWMTNLWNTEQPGMLNKETFRSDGEREENENEVIERYHETASKPPSKETKSSAEEMWITDMRTTIQPETFSKKSTWDYGERIEGKEETSKSFSKVTNEESSERIHTSTEERQKMNLWTTESLEIFNKNTLLDHNKRIEEKGKATETYYEMTNEPTSKRTEIPANQEWKTQAWSSNEPGMFSTETWGNSGTEEEIDKTTKQFSKVTNKPTSEKAETPVEQELRTKVWSTEEPEMFSKVTLWEHNEKVEEKSKTSKKYSKVTNEPTSEKPQADEGWRTQEWGREKTEVVSTETLWDYDGKVEERDKTTKNYETTNVQPSERTEAPTNKEWNTKQLEMFSRKTMWGHGEREDINEETTRTNFDTTNEFISEKTGKLLEKTSPGVAKNSTEGSFEVIKEEPKIFSHNTQITAKETLVTKPVLNEETGATKYDALDKSHNIYHETTTSKNVETASVPNGKLWQSNEYNLITKNNSQTRNFDADIYGQSYYQIHLLYYPFRNKYGVSYLPYSEQFMLWWHKHYGNLKNKMNNTSYFADQSWWKKWNQNPNINRTERNNSINWNDGMHFTWSSSSIHNREFPQSLYRLAHYIYYPIKQGSTIWYHHYSELSQKWNYYLHNKQNNNGPNEDEYHDRKPGSSFTNGTRFLYDIPEQRYVNEKFRFNVSRYYPFKYGSTIFYRGYLYHDNLHNTHNVSSGVDNSFVITNGISYYPIKRGETIWYYSYVPLYHKSNNEESRISKYQKYIYYPLKKGSKIWYYNYITYSNSDMRSHISKYQNYIYYPLMRGSTLWYYNYVMLQNDKIYNDMAYPQRYNLPAHETNYGVSSSFQNNGTWRNRFQPGINKTSYVNGFEIGNNGASGSGPHDVSTQQTSKWKIGHSKGNVTHGSVSSTLNSRHLAYYPYKDGRKISFQPFNSHQGTTSRLYDQNEIHSKDQLNISHNEVQGEPAYYIYIYSTGKPYSKVWNQSLHYAYYPIQNPPVVRFCPSEMYYSKFYTGLRFSMHSSAASTNSHIRIGVKKNNEDSTISNKIYLNYAPKENIRPHNQQWSKTRRLSGLNLHYYPHITKASVYYIKMVPYSKLHFKQNGSFSKYYSSNMTSDQVHHETEPSSNTNQKGTSYSHSTWSYSQQTNFIDSLFNKFYYYRHASNEAVITNNRTVVNSSPVHNYTSWNTEHHSASHSVPVSPQSSSWKITYHYKIFPNGTKYLVSSGGNHYSGHQASTAVHYNSTHGQNQFFPGGAQHYSDGSRQYYYGQPSSTLQNNSYWQSYQFPSTNHTYGTSNKITYHYKIFPNGTKYLVSSGGNHYSGHQASTAVHYNNTHGQNQFFPGGAQHYSVGSKQYYYGQPSSTLQNSSYWQSYQFPSTNHTYGTSNKITYHYKIFPNGTKYLVSSGGNHYSGHQASTAVHYNNTHGQNQFFPGGAQHYSVGSKQYYYGQPSSTLQNSSYWQSYQFPSTNHTYGTSNKITYHYKIFPNGTKYLVSSGGNHYSGHQASTAVHYNNTHGQNQFFPGGAQHYSVGSKQYYYGQPSSTLQNSSYWQSYQFPSTNHTYGTSNKITYHYKIFPNGTKYLVSSGGNHYSGHQASTAVHYNSTHGQNQFFPGGAQHYSVGSKQYYYGQPSSTLKNSSYWQSYQFPSTNHTYGTSNKITYHYKIFPNGTKYLVSSGGNHYSGHQASTAVHYNSTHGQTQFFPGSAQHYSVGSKQYYYGQPSSTLQNTSYWQSYQYPNINHTYGTSNKNHYSSHHFSQYSPTLHNGTYFHSYQLPNGTQYYSSKSNLPSFNSNNRTYWHSGTFQNNTHWHSQAIPIYSSQRTTNLGSHSVSSHAFKTNGSNWQTNWSSSIQYNGQPYQVSNSRVHSSSYHYGPMNVSTVSRNSGAPEIKISQTVYNDGKSVPYSTHSVRDRRQRSAPILETEDSKIQNYTLSKNDVSASVYNITEELNSNDTSSNGTTNSSNADNDLVSETNGSNYENSVNSTIDYDLVGKFNTDNLLENTTYRQENVSGTSEELNNTTVEEELLNDNKTSIDCNDTVSKNSSDISSIANNNSVSKIDNETLSDVSNNETSLYEDYKNDNLIGTSPSQTVNGAKTERVTEDKKQNTDPDKSAVQSIGEEETSVLEERDAKKPIKFMLSVSMSLDTPEIIELAPLK